MINKKINKNTLYEYLKGVSKIDDKEKFEKDHAISYKELSDAFKNFFKEREIQLD